MNRKEKRRKKERPVFGNTTQIRNVDNVFLPPKANLQIISMTDFKSLLVIR